MRPRAALGAALSALLALASPAQAQPRCPSSDRPFVELTLEVEPPDRLIAMTLEQHLRSELGAREIDLCPPASGVRRALARVRLRVNRSPEGPLVAIIEVGDDVTDKRVERTLDLTKLPPDSRPLAVAAATDELLRASWAELTVTDAPAPLLPPPAAVLRAVASSVRPSAAAEKPPSPGPRFELGVLGGGSAFFAGPRTAFGGDLSASVWVAPRFALDAGVGGNVGLARTSLHGQARLDALEAELGASYALSSELARAGVHLEGGGRVMAVSFVSSADASDRTAQSADWTALLVAGARAWVRTGRLRWSLGVDALVTLRPLRATDAGVTVSGIEGVGAAANGGVAVLF